jgi:multiple sugar transport system substrate-binding protein
VSGPDLYLAFEHSSGRAKTAVEFLTWLTSAPVHLQFAIMTGDLPVRESESKLPDYAKFLAKYPSNKVFVENLDNVKHVRPNIASYSEVSTALGQMVQSVLLGKAEPQKALDAAEAQVSSALAGQ